MEALSRVLNTVVLESGSIQIDLGELIVIFCCMIAMLLNMLLLLSLINPKKK